jgi:hypothetical protein
MSAPHPHDDPAAEVRSIGDHGRAPRRPSRRQLASIAALVPLVLAAVYLVDRSMGSDDTASGVKIVDAGGADHYDWNYVITPGTATRIAAGEDVEIIPAELTVHVGDSIRIENDDDANHIVGVFYVAAHSTVTQRFKTAGDLSGECTVHPSGGFTLHVVP